MNVSKVDENNLEQTGLDEEKLQNRIIVSVNNYVDSLAEIIDIRKVSGTENLMKLEQKQYGIYVGKFKNGQFAMAFSKSTVVKLFT